VRVPQSPNPDERDATSFIGYKIERKAVVCMDQLVHPDPG
jgi:hypothetical protein